MLRREVVIHSPSAIGMRIPFALLSVAFVAASLTNLALNSSAGLAADTLANPRPITAPEPTRPVAGAGQVELFNLIVQDDGDDDEPDVLLMALATVGVAGAGAVLGLIGYVIRNRVGFWLHRPPPREGSAGEEHQ